MITIGRTKKVGSAGRFGARYGRKIKLNLTKIEKKLRRKHQCPSCKKTSLKRLVAGIWRCKSCGVKFAGGAYEPKSEQVRVG